jgi:maltooligosyltrehalose trehalohydrolase
MAGWVHDDHGAAGPMTVLRVWAPRARRVRVKTVVEGHRAVLHELKPGPDDWWNAEVGDIEVGTDYGFLLDDDEVPLPGPRSRRLPHGVHGLSRLYDSRAYAWHDQYWTGRDLPGAVIYELHIGTFTAEGTFAAAIDRLDHVAGLGVTHVELLPVNAFNGEWNWGYDGVGWFAVHEPYGGPDGLKRFVDACHARGLAVILDVVYNHFGPSGNYLPRFGPYLKEGSNTWGSLVNFDGEGSEQVRQYVLDNALMWFEEFHVDALRLDAIHALADTTKPHILAALAADVDALCAHLGRPLVLIAESDLNDPMVIEGRSAGGYGMDAQWDDDFHHQVHALLTGERQGYYADFGTLPGLAKVLTSAFFHDGTYSEFRKRPHGAPIDRVATPGYRFVVSLQNHDQVGNRATGERLTTLTTPGRLRIGALLLLTAPFTPMLWMGEEWGAATPWQFFTSHPEPDIAAATTRGRTAEFAEHGWSQPAADPQDPRTFQRSKLRWSEVDAPGHADLLRLYRGLITLRRREASLSDPRLDRVHCEYDDETGWLRMHRGRLRVVVNLADRPQTIPVDRPIANVLISTARGFHFDATGITLPAESGVVVQVV